MMGKEKVRDTFSLCPVCLQKIPAVLARTDGAGIVMEKTCPVHGAFSVPVWKGRFSFEDWICGEPPISEGTETAFGCTGDCRNCAGHPQGTCCVILEVTEACNLSCRYCFANGGETSEMPPFEGLKDDIDQIVHLAGDPLLQFAGGEPTLRDDLSALVRYAKEAGCSYTQVNTNGIRLADDEEYVRSLAEAGLDIVFLQFDGIDDGIYRTLRGRDLLAKKLRAIRNCDKYHIGVTLAPTIVRGVNDHQIGDVIRTAVQLFPAVRSVHFQPVTYLGRYPQDGKERFTLDELMQAVVDQTGIPGSVLLPSRCDHAACEFHATFIVDDEKRLIPVSNRAEDGRTRRTSARENRQYVAEHWRRPESEKQTVSYEKSICIDRLERDEPQSVDHGLPCPLRFGKTDDMDFDVFIRYMKTRVLKISAMAFQDAMNLDLERLSRCSLHVYENGKLLPFCGKYLTPLP